MDIVTFTEERRQLPQRGGHSLEEAQTLVVVGASSGEEGDCL
jgi:hypothetical protein